MRSRRGTCCDVTLHAPVIITRTPLRLSLGGGGTDLPSYYEHHGGMVIAAAIDKYVFVAMNRTFTDDYFLKYSSLERVTSSADIEHPIVREAFEGHKVEPAVEMVSVADIPSGTGLGSSGSFTVGLLRAIYAYQRSHATPSILAEEACSIEIDKLGRPVGKQDQYIAAFGGFTCFYFEPGGQVSIAPLQLTSDTLHDLEEHLLMFFTGYSRDAEHMLEDQKSRSERGDSAMIDSLHFVKEVGLSSKNCLETGDTEQFAFLMHEHWMRKRERSQGMTNDQIDKWYQLGMGHGALGGKLVGAGAGGFLLFYAKDPTLLRRAMQGEGLTEVRFQFDHDGSVVLARD
jgi:D-glycero-alpha-D-manno-heptose-7-phosphate kinase